MLTRLCCLTLIGAILTPIAAAADRPLRVSTSASGRFQLRIDTGRPDRSGPAAEDRVRAAGAPADSVPDDGELRGDEPETDEPFDAETGDRSAPETGEPQATGGVVRRTLGRRETQGVGARLIDREARGAGRVRWEGRLVNEVAPGQAFVHDDGRWVVTLDDFRLGGAQHAVVVYDSRGALRREFTLDELLTADDRRHVERRGAALVWLEGAQCRFVSDPDRFVIRLRSQREIWIDLESAELTTDAHIALHDESDWADALAAAGGDDAEALEQKALMERLIAEHLEAQTDSDDEIVREVLRLAIEQQLAQLDDAEALALRERLEQARASAETSPDQPGEATAEATDQPGPPGETPDEPNVAGEADPDAGKIILGGREFVVQPSAEAILEWSAFEIHFSRESGSLILGAVGPVEVSATAGIDVPTPDPARPVDYIAWMNEQAATDGPNAAPLLQAAVGAHVPLHDEDGTLESAAFRGDPAALSSPAVTAWLEANRAAMDQLASASRLDYRGMPVHSEDGLVMGILLPNLSPVRGLAKAMVADGKRLEVLEGQPQAALERYMQVLEAGAQQSRGPTLIENLVGNAVQRLASEAVLDALANAGDALDYTELATQLEQRYRPLRPMAETLQFERVMLLDVVQRAYTYDASTGSYQVSPDGAQLLASVSGLHDGGTDLGVIASLLALNAAGFEQTLSRANAHYDEMTVAAQLPYAEGRTAWSQLEQRLEDPAFRMSNPLLATLLPSMSRAGQLSTQAEAQRRATGLVAKIKAYRQQHGAYPPSLDAIGSYMTVDPFTGQPFVYRTDGGEFSLYSAGIDGVDNGGADWDRSQQSGDLRFWPRPAKK
ncbi:MAG TPA: hypothetical protein PKC49_05715 [Phycisphaerae bacterium]|nr:hypothetical protein [Phycisphaerae bacterium]